MGGKRLCPSDAEHRRDPRFLRAGRWTGWDVFGSPAPNAPAGIAGSPAPTAPRHRHQLRRGTADSSARAAAASDSPSERAPGSAPRSAATTRAIPRWSGRSAPAVENSAGRYATPRPTPARPDGRPSRPLARDGHAHLDVPNQVRPQLRLYRRERCIGRWTPRLPPCCAGERRGLWSLRLRRLRGPDARRDGDKQ